MVRTASSSQKAFGPPLDLNPLDPESSVQDEAFGQELMEFMPDFCSAVGRTREDQKQDESSSVGSADEQVYDENEESDSDSEDERGGNGLNIHVNYCSQWTLNEAVREVMQNTIDGAVEYMRETRPEAKRQDLCPAGKMWYRKKITSPKKFRDAGFLHAGRAEMILSMKGSCDCEEKLPTNKRLWHQNRNSYAYICFDFASREEIDWESFEKMGQQPDGTILIKCEAINRVLHTFRIRHLCRIGKTLKSGKNDQAGKFGEGFKVGAVVAVRNHVAVDVQGRGKRIKFKIKKRQLSFTRHNSSLTKEARENKRLVFVKLHLTKPPTSPDLQQRYRFDISFFRLLHPGSPFAVDGQVLREPINKGKIYCMGILVCTENNVFLGYDINDKDLVSGRDRNEAAKQRLRIEIARLLNRCKKDDEELIPYLLEKMLEIEEEEKLHRGQEVIAVRADAALCKDLSICFQNRKGENAFPIKKSEKKKFHESLRNLDPIELLDPLVDILRKGDYRNIDDQVDYLLSDENKVDVDDKEGRLLESCVWRVKRVAGAFEISRDNIVVVNSNKLNSKYHRCKARTNDNGLSKFYIPQDLLRITEKSPFLRTSNKLGFSIASKIPSMKVDGMNIEDLEDFAFNYGEENDSTSSWFQIEISKCQKYLSVCKETVARATIVQVSKLESNEGESEETFELKVQDEQVQLPHTLAPGSKYIFTAVDENGQVLHDPLTQKSCIIEHLFTPLETDSVQSHHESFEEGEDSVGEETLVHENSRNGQPESQNDDSWCNEFGDSGDDYYEPLSSNDNTSLDDCDYPEILNDLTNEEMSTVFGDGENYYDDFDLSSESSSEDEEDEQPSKRPRRPLPCDETHAVFFGNRITRGEVYSHRNEQDVWYVRVVGFVGKKLPVRRARCHILKPLHSAISSFFNNAKNKFGTQHNPPHARLNALPSGMEYNDLLQTAREWVLEDIEMGDKFMKTLLPSDANFDSYSNSASLVTKREGKKWLEFRRRDVAKSDFVPCLRTPRELVLFAGVGGSSIGDKQVGFDVEWLVENDPLAAASLRGSHPHARIYQEDVRSFHKKCKERKAGYPREGHVDHLQASPPCQGFSLANRGGGRYDKRNNSLSLEVVRSLAILKPRTAMLENVQGMVRPKHLNYVFQIIHESIALGYQVRFALHNADEFGGAQKRKRVIFTFARNDTVLPEFPTSTSQNEAKILDDVLEGLSERCDMDTGSGLVQLPNRDFTFNHVASTPRADMEILSRHEAVNTLTTQNSASLAHPDNPARTLSMRELARLFSYPDDKQFFGSLTAIRRQIGNSVPVNLAKAIALPIFKVHKSRRRTA